MIYDLIIIGGGPAGLSAAIYAARYKLKIAVFSKNIGGTAATASKICNFPSYTNITGYEFMQKMTEQVKSLSVPVFYDEVIKIERKKESFIVKTEKGEYSAKKILYAAGTKRKRLNVPGEGKFHGRGVSYCATCDAAFFKEKIVCVVGGSDAALTSALLLSEFASKVYIIYRKSEFFRGDPTWIDLIKKEKKIKVLFEEEITEIKGDTKVEEIALKSGKNIKVNGVFIEAGSTPETSLLLKLGVELSDHGYIITDRHQRTNVQGIYAAGDVTKNPLKQIVVATSEGAIAAYSIYLELKEGKKGR